MYKYCLYYELRGENNEITANKSFYTAKQALDFVRQIPSEYKKEKLEFFIYFSESKEPVGIEYIEQQAKIEEALN